MRLILEDNDKLIVNHLPSEISGSFNLKDSCKVNLVNIEAINNEWILFNNIDIKILKDVNRKENEILSNVNQLESVELKEFKIIYLYDINKKQLKKLYCFPTYDSTLMQLLIDNKNNSEIIIGCGSKSTINISNPFFAEKQITINLKNNNYNVVNNNLKLNLYINNVKEVEKTIFNGDVIFIEGISICIVGNLLIINNPNDIVSYNSLKLSKRISPIYSYKDYSTEQNSFIEYFEKNSYFQRPPRFKRFIEIKNYNVDPPVQSFIPEDEMPMIYTLGPMMLMGLTSLMSGFNAIMNVISGKSSFAENSMSIITCIVMFSSMLIFPFLQRLYVKHIQHKKERKRRRKYKKYINEIKEEILQEINLQKQILIENNCDLNTTKKTILNCTRNLWERKLEDNDFLNIRLGVGNVKPLIKINVPEKHFSMDEDDLRDVYTELFDTIKDIESVPVTINLLQNKIVGMIGNYNFIKEYLNSFILQILAYQGYDNLKIVILSSNEKRNTWDKYKNIPHFWNNDKTFRYMGFNIDDNNKISNYLINLLNNRTSNIEDNQDYKEVIDSYLLFKEYYLIISDDIDYIKSSNIFNSIKKINNNIGFSFLLITERVDNLPNECTTFINIEKNNCGLFKNELLSNNQINFIPDLETENLNKCYTALCNVPIDINTGKFSLPKTYSFLEMYDVGNVKQLNIVNRWKDNNIIQSLSAPVGINEQGELFKIDLHEKVHGPHGLVAGMTGSGKSEWIITYILSMCINYHPDEVQFVLIDYKGGGLAGTFENKETGFKIPHLVGTITNLDITEISRSLASINSELKRRQSLFNDARNQLGESSVDIYKYQQWYRDGKIDEPISHLFLISDEFAELKSQQPEFMAELISTARIGRSLGVHLILATQKPSGVVDEQIWSNSKFRVCLKVQDKSDSKEMIQVPDAAFLKEAGRFYLQVGYNEYFALGQSAYAGGLYYEGKRHKKQIDTDICFIDDLGNIYKNINNKKNNVSVSNKGDELSNILKEIVECGKSVNTHIRKLWLDAIPAVITIEDLLKKYEYKKENYILNPVIGEYDVPARQSQFLLTLPISKNGNTLIYGASGSGKEETLSLILYSLSTTYCAQEINTYVIDCGSEFLNNYKNSPIVGDVILNGNDEKLNNLFKFLENELDSRKKMLVEYNSDYYYYCSKSGKTIPNILVIINNYESFQDSYEKYIDVLIQLSRDGEKYGIFFMISLNTPSGIRMKLSQNFKQNIVLQMNDISDYIGVLGSYESRIIPSKCKCRGLIRIDDVYELQVASITKDDNVVDYLKNTLTLLKNNANSFAPAIKILPKNVNIELLKNVQLNLSSFPIGIETESLEIAKYNFNNNKGICVSTEDETLLKIFGEAFVSIFANNNQSDDTRLIVIDNYNLSKINNNNIVYLSNNYSKGLETFYNYMSNDNNKKKSLIIFTGFNEIYKNLTNSNDYFKRLFHKIKSLNNYSLLVFDTIDNILKLLYEDWFEESIDRNNGIWLGNGISEQSLIKTNKSSKIIREEIDDKKGYYIINGKAIRIQYITTEND